MMRSQRAAVIAHADWSTSEGKRRIAAARTLPGGGFRVCLTSKVDQPEELLAELRELAGPEGCALVGFDFPIGLPAGYAAKAGISSFLDTLSCFGAGDWESFFQVACHPEEISVHRPFYPNHPTGTRRSHLTEALGLEWTSLYRQCERKRPDRRAACPLFWTLGGQQVGKAALHGWKHVLAPALNSTCQTLSIWPFSGNLLSLLSPGNMVVVETYPAEFYSCLGIKFPKHGAGKKSGKRQQSDRQNNATALLNCCRQYSIELEPELEAQVRDGFGPYPWGEDTFDAFTGLVGMIRAMYEWTDAYEPSGSCMREVEGWIFGQPVHALDQHP